ncbi:MAG: leucine-rich repeat domain-containing protein [Holosporales bacterium]|nr:leucine-rich repeat domain-containing protein [Holosporales bacterium]
MSTAINLLGSVSSCIESGPSTSNYRTLVRTNVDKIKEDLLAAQTEFTEIAEELESVTEERNTALDDLDDMTVLRNTAVGERDAAISARDLYKKIVLATFPLPQSSTLPSLSAIPAMLSDTTTLVLIHQSSVSLTDAALAQITRMVVVGTYAPTGLTYSKLTNLQSLRMFNGTMNTTVQDYITTLATTSRKLRYLEIPQWGTTIKASAFACSDTTKNSSIQQLVGFNDVTTVGNQAFSCCANLTSISLPNVTTFAINSDEQSHAFAYSGLTSFFLPKLTSVCDFAFQGCNSLTSASLKITTVGDRMFGGCSSLTSVTLPNATSVRSCTFEYCSSLISLTLNITATSWRMCYDCSSLKTITLPLLTSTEELAFYGCTGLISLTVPLLTVANTGNRAFAGGVPKGVLPSGFDIPRLTS